ncbi:hypothetical protein P280DRAFT_458881 [Massarina eburnea CBS 473.64]|uniref:Uncharacterized protein n=1 Tax=Massarina eburnea CBS 473.64 TaxID=1395130 RepID=A0A6A6RPC6_9PLEO|nr:hypothetical protein P280DRAFT_458881 [Massarina eburnea CBS 473.64]
MSQITLYDIPTREPKKAWSLNPWKPRMILNYKAIPYTTQWIEYPDLAHTLSALSIPPHDPTTPGYYTAYTSPALRHADGKTTMDSWEIAQELEARYPEPSLRLEEPIVGRIRDVIVGLREPLNAWWMPKVPERVLGKESAEYFERTREVRLGMSLGELGEKADEECWVKAKGPALEVAELLKENGGPFFLGETVVSYADFIFVSFLHFLKTVDANVYERYLEFDPAFGRIYEASKQWLERDD